MGCAKPATRLLLRDRQRTISQEIRGRSVACPLVQIERWPFIEPAQMIVYPYRVADRQSAFSEERSSPLSIIAQSVRTDLESRTRLRPSQVRVHIRATLPLRRAICPARTIEASQNNQGFRRTPD